MAFQPKGVTTELTGQELKECLEVLSTLINRMSW